MLKITKIDLELIPDTDMHIIFNKLRKILSEEKVSISHPHQPK